MSMFIRLKTQLLIFKKYCSEKNCILKERKNKNDSYRSNIFCNKSKYLTENHKLEFYTR